MKTIRKFNRFELKYILPHKLSRDVKKDLSQQLEKDSYSTDGKYEMNSLYYDTDDYKFYWEKIEGIRFRRKLRIRRYIDDGPLTNDSPVYIEIKQRLNKVTQKRRVKMKYADALKFCNQGITPKYQKEDALVIEEIESMIRTYNLKPQLITSYKREAYVGGYYDVGLRVTFDTDISYMRKNLDLSNQTAEDFIISPNQLIMEVKVNERVPFWITEIIAKYNLKLIRISKYTQGLERTSVVPESFYHLNQ